MAIARAFIDRVAISAKHISGPKMISWPTAENPAAIIRFDTFAEWRRFVLQFTLANGVPKIVTQKFERAQKIYLLSWIDFDLIKAGELVCLAALELALCDRYEGKVKKDRKTLSGLLQYMVEEDGLVDNLLPMCVRSGGQVVRNLYETGANRRSRKLIAAAPPMTLVEIRNSLAHGYPFDGLPWGGLLELVRDLIEYGYRDMPAASTAISPRLSPRTTPKN